jgi:DNA polymerase I-like protein with 3'-5' exonuclease and polymerase domains
MTESILKINKLLENYNSKLILYQYDSLIFDIHKKEEKDIIDKIKDIMENINNMKFKVKIKTGKTLKEIR